MSTIQTQSNQAPNAIFEGTLFFARQRGYYVVRRGREERAVFAGTRLKINLSGQWIAGRIEHREVLYACKDVGTGIFGGYFFAADGSGMAGLCAGMHVRVLSEG